MEDVLFLPLFVAVVAVGDFMIRTELRIWMCRLWLHGRWPS